MKEFDEIQKIEQLHTEQINQALEDAKAGKISFEEAKRIVLADTQQAMTKLKDLLPKKDTNEISQD